jgi:hypothetical protein
MRYIEQVLPSLGEQDVQLSTISGLKPQLRTARVEADDIAAVKGSARMSRVIGRAVRDRQRVLHDDVTFMLDGLRIRFSREDSARVVRGAQRQKGTHNERRPYVVRRTVDILVSAYKLAATRAYERRRIDSADAAGNDQNVIDFQRATVDSLIGRAIARGDSLPEGFEPELAGRLRRRPEVIEALERMWPVLSGARRSRRSCHRPSRISCTGPAPPTPNSRAGPMPMSRSSTRPRRCSAPWRPRRRASDAAGTPTRTRSPSASA